jgi:Na+/H+ antiporter NhaD/arsenite permease-like protein
VALVVDVVTFGICRWWFADAFDGFSAAVHQEFALSARSRTVGEPVLASVGGNGSRHYIDSPESEPDPHGSLLSGEYFEPAGADTIDDFDARKTYRLSWALLLTLILLLVTHRVTEKLLGLHEGTMMVAAALIMGCVVLMLRREKARELVERRVDWWTLAFFMMLFASVGTLQDTGVTQVIADRLNGLGGSNHTMVIQIIGWATGWLSAFLDNVLAVATFMPVVHDVRAHAGGPYESSIYWLMLFGGTFMGNMTIIGSTANIVACGLLEKRGHGTIRFGYWMKIGFIVSIASMLVASALLEVERHVIPWSATLPPPQSIAQ